MVAIRIFYLFVVIIILETLAHFGGQYYYSQKYQADKDFDVRNYNQSRFTKIEQYVKALKDENYLSDKLVYKIVEVPAKEPENLDELINEARIYWTEVGRRTIKDSITTAQRRFVAMVKTNFEDGLVSFDAEYTSPIPLHPRGSFSFTNIKVKQTNTITTSVDEIKLPYKESFFDRFVVTIGAGAGYGLINKTPDFYVGLQIGYKIKNLF